MSFLRRVGFDLVVPEFDLLRLVERLCVRKTERWPAETEPGLGKHHRRRVEHVKERLVFDQIPRPALRELDRSVDTSIF